MGQIISKYVKYVKQSQQSWDEVTNNERHQINILALNIYAYPHKRAYQSSVQGVFDQVLYTHVDMGLAMLIGYIE